MLFDPVPVQGTLEELGPGDQPVPVALVNSGHRINVMVEVIHLHPIILELLKIRDLRGEPGHTPPFCIALGELRPQPPKL